MSTSDGSWAWYSEVYKPTNQIKIKVTDICAYLFVFFIYSFIHSFIYICTWDMTWYDYIYTYVCVWLSYILYFYIFVYIYIIYLCVGDIWYMYNVFQPPAASPSDASPSRPSLSAAARPLPSAWRQTSVRLPQLYEAMGYGFSWLLIWLYVMIMICNDM